MVSAQTERAASHANQYANLTARRFRISCIPTPKSFLNKNSGIM